MFSASPSPAQGLPPADASMLRALKHAEILHEGALSVRQNKGWVGLRRWMTRYYVICRTDWTLRRYKSVDEAEAPTRLPRCLSLRDVDYIRADGASRFLITLIDGAEIKLSGDTSADTRACSRLGLCRAVLGGAIASPCPRALTHAPIATPLNPSAHNR